MIAKEYMGDSVYASLSSERNDAVIELTTENGLPEDPSNQIFLEPEVLKALIRYAFKHGIVRLDAT